MTSLFSSAALLACGCSDALQPNGWTVPDASFFDGAGGATVDAADGAAARGPSDAGERETGTDGGKAGGDSGTPPLPDASVDAGTDPYSGPFKVLVLSATPGFHHDSIPAGQQMLRDLGGCFDDASCALTNDIAIPGAKPNSSFTVVVAGAPDNCPPATPANYTTYGAMDCDGHTVDLSQFAPENLKNYQMIFFVNPNGNVFTGAGQPGTVGMAAVQAFIESGGAYGGLHSASDFEDRGSWPWYYNSLMGAYFVTHNGDGTIGTLTTDPMYLMHPVMRGLAASSMGPDEWYLLNRPVSMQPGFQILETVSGQPPLNGEQPGAVRPMVWVKQFPVATDPTREGRSFYTARGHNIARYAEAPFRQLIHQGILWATHRLN